MYGGMVMESGASTEIISRPQHPYTRALLASSPRFGSHYAQQRLPAIPGKVTDPSNPEPGCPFAPRCTEAQPSCSAGLPPLKTTDGRALRCVK
jgi:peptide/nickel transport system permease protein